MEETEAIFNQEEKLGLTILRIIGEVDIANVHELETALAEAEAGTGDLLLDMTEVRYMDSSGFAALLDCARRLKNREAQLHLAGCSGTIRRLLEVTRLQLVFKLHPDVPSAERALLTVVSG